eukprot:826625-Pleurochrysis_carterae.AAC.11
MATATRLWRNALVQVARRTTHKKKKVLLLCSRGVTSSNIELLEDLLKLMPHSKKDSKFDKRELLSTLKEIAQLVGCHYCMHAAVCVPSKKISRLRRGSSARVIT